MTLDTITKLVDANIVEGAELLDALCAFFRRFCVFPDDHALIAVTLWAAHAHMVKNFHTTPRLALLSPEPASGKTRVLEVLDLLVPESLFCLSASPAAIFRTLAKKQITLLVDECDTIFSKRGKDDGNEDLRALLNAGYKRGASVPRCVGPKHEVQNFEVHCATALAGLGDLPETVMSRSVIIKMRRRAPGENVEPFRSRQHESLGHRLRDRLSVWGETVGGEAGKSWPRLPTGIVDRPAEVWEPLIATADAAGGAWPERARKACVELCRTASDRKVSLGIRLLADLRTIFRNDHTMHTDTILSRLADGERYGLEADAPWAELHGKPLGPRGLASMLKKYGVTPEKVTIGGESFQGYRSEHLWDAWQRYLPSPGTAEAEVRESPESTGRELLIAVPVVPEIPQVRNGEGAVRPQYTPDLLETCRNLGLQPDRAIALLEGSDPNELTAQQLEHYLSHRLREARA